MFLGGSKEKKKRTSDATAARRWGSTGRSRVSHPLPLAQRRHSLTRSYLSRRDLHSASCSTSTAGIPYGSSVQCGCASIGDGKGKNERRSSIQGFERSVLARGSGNH